LLKTYSVWLSSPADAGKLFTDEEERHAQRLAEYEGYRHQIERNQNKALRAPSSPHFATYATLLRGIGFEQAYIGWCRWMIKNLKRSPPRKNKPLRRTTKSK
jgi:hypothetical protein